MLRTYFYPPKFPKEAIGGNTYIDDFIKALSPYVDILNKEDISRVAIMNYYKYLFRADVYIFNWIESIATKKLGALQFLFFIFTFPVLIFRKVKIVWIFHNITPHQGEFFFSRIIKKLMYKYSSLIVTHSEESLHYVENCSNTKVVFLNHPIKSRNYILLSDKKKEVDFLIWGTVDRYKGITNFLQFLKEQNLLLKYQIKIIGKCKDEIYKDEIDSFCNANIVLENRSADFEELADLISRSKYVLFPYLTNSISSSGALMDTISMGGNVIGPNSGAFRDMKNINLSQTYETYNDILEIVEDNRCIDYSGIEIFIKENSWDEFIKHFLEII